MLSEGAPFFVSVTIKGTNGGAEMVTDAQKRAVAKYQREKTTQINLKFSPHEQDLYEWVKKQGGTASGYVKSLIRKDMQERA